VSGLPGQPHLDDTFYEQLTCVGLNPDLDVIEATVVLKQGGGYNGDLCSQGSREWVRFYISYDSGATWADVGLSSFEANDVPVGLDCAEHSERPLVYSVAHQLTNTIRKSCTVPVLPLIRAILSWQAMPPANQPNWHPIWGNVLEHHVQVKPRRLLFSDVIAAERGSPS
jgi:hypothetical protein